MCIIYEPSGAGNNCSVESVAHLLRCAACRGSDAASAARLALCSWAAVSEPASASCEEVIAWLADKLARSLGEPTAALRHLMSFAALGDRRDTADPMHVPPLAAEGILKPGTRVPVPAVAAIVRALGVRAILDVVEVRGKPVVWGSVGATSAPFLGGLLVSDGHMSAVLCDDPGP